MQRMAVPGRCRSQRLPLIPHRVGVIAIIRAGLGAETGAA